MCWRRMENGEEVLHRVKEERNIVRTVNRRKANWIGHILCRNCHLKQVIEGKVEGRRRRDVSSYCIILRKREDTVN
jgi:hypothetical protein